MPEPRGSRFPCIPVVPVFVVTLSLLMLWIAVPGVARADSKEFVAAFHGDAFDAAAAAAAQSASPTIAKIRVQEPGLLTEDNSLLNAASEVWRDSSPATIHSVFPASSNSSDETPRVYGAVTYDMQANQGAKPASSAPQWATNFDGGFYLYPGVSGLVDPSGQLFKGAVSDRIDLASGHSGEGDVNSSNSSGTRHNGVVPRIKRPFRILAAQPFAVPEPSSLLMLWCGIFVVGLRRKYLSVK